MSLFELFVMFYVALFSNHLQNQSYIRTIRFMFYFFFHFVQCSPKKQISSTVSFSYILFHSLDYFFLVFIKISHCAYRTAGIECHIFSPSEIKKVCPILRVDDLQVRELHILCTVYIIIFSYILFTFIQSYFL